MLDLGTLRINISADTSAAKKNLTDVQKTTEQVEKTTDQSTKNMTNSWKTFSTTVKTLAVTGLAAVVGGVASLVSTASESAAEMGKLETAFNSVGYSTETAQGVFQDFVGLLGETDTAVEASNHLARLCTSEDQLAQWTNIAAGAFATFGDSMPLESLTEAANETAKTGTVVGTMADALNWAGVSEDEFNQKLAACNDEQERAQLITDTLNSLYGETGQTYRDNNQALIEYNEAQAQLRQNLSDLGEILMPIVTEIQNFANSLLESAKPALQAIVDALPQIKQTFMDLLPIITGVAAGFVTFKAAMAISGIVSTAIGLFNSMKTALTGASVAQNLLNMAMKANPIILIVSLVAMLVTALITLWNTNEGFREAVTNAWNTISSVASTVWGAIVNFFTVTIPAAIQNVINWFAQLPTNIANFLNMVITSVVTWVSNMVSNAVNAGSQFLSNVVNFISQVPGQVASFLGNVISNVVGFVGDMASNATQAASDFFNNIVNGLAGLPGEMLSIGQNIVQGIIDGITGMIGSAVSAVGNLASNIAGAVTGFFGIASPSKLFKQYGNWLMEGLDNGIEGGTNGAVKAAMNAARAVTGAFTTDIPNVEANYRAYASRTAAKSGSGAVGSVTNNNYYIGNTSVDTITEQRFAEEFISLMTRYGRLATT